MRRSYGDFTIERILLKDFEQRFTMNWYYKYRKFIDCCLNITKEKVIVRNIYVDCIIYQAEAATKKVYTLGLLRPKGFVGDALLTFTGTKMYLDKEWPVAKNGTWSVYKGRVTCVSFNSDNGAYSLHAKVGRPIDRLTTEEIMEKADNFWKAIDRRKYE